MSKVFILRGAVKNYDWGKLGLDSCVAYLHNNTCQEKEINENVPYAELWMGTHPSGPSIIPSQNDITLFDWINENPDTLGTCIKSRFKELGLPFLFKVLSIRKSLSIQVHPDKTTAEVLHKKYSHLYPDDNHKPELAIALTNFQALCGFRPVHEIQAFLLELPQLQKIISSEAIAEFLDSENQVNNLKKVFVSVITCIEDKFKQVLDSLVQYFSTNMSLSDHCKSVKDSFLTIHAEYPGDVGCFCVFFLNIMNLNPGEAIFLAANEPHAYLKGDCIECMACSDNVVRAGLTPKYKDVDTLCNLLQYQCKSAKENLFPFTLNDDDPCVMIYNPPVPEFAVARINVDALDSDYLLATLDSASILLVVEGEAVATESNESKTIPLQSGTIVFISCNVELKVQATSKLTMYRAYCSA